MKLRKSKNKIKRGRKMFTKLTNKLDSFIEMGIPGYDCTVYHKGECVYRHFNGYSDTESKTPMNGNEVYNIYSCSKVITCTAALILYEKGKFKIEDKLAICICLNLKCM